LKKKSRVMQFHENKTHAICAVINKQSELNTQNMHLILKMCLFYSFYIMPTSQDQLSFQYNFNRLLIF